MFNNKPFKYRVSSVLNRENKLYGKKHLFDGNEESAWNSDQGLPQWILLQFEEEEKLTGFTIQFQGGFAGKDCHIECADENGEMKFWEIFSPQDSNKKQTFDLKNPLCSKRIKFVFNTTTDFFGRIIIYQFELKGT